MKKCYVLDVEIINGNEHHVIMQAKGGRSGKTVFLRPDIHDLLHHANSEQLDALFAKLNVGQKQRFLFLKKCLDLEGKDEVKKRLSFEVSAEAFKRLKIEAESRGIGVNRYVAEQIESKFGGK